MDVTGSSRSESNTGGMGVIVTERWDLEEHPPAAATRVTKQPYLGAVVVTLICGNEKMS